MVKTITNTNIIDDSTKENDLSTTKADIIKEQDIVRKDINSKVIDDVDKFKTTGHVSQLQRSNNFDLFNMSPTTVVFSKKQK